MAEISSIVGKLESKKTAWVENPYLPTKRILANPTQQAEFIEELHNHRGFYTITCKKLGFHVRSLERRMVELPQFAKAVQAVRKSFETITYHQLEELSENQALIPSNTTERIFQLNALNSPKYRPKTANQGITAVQVSIGIDIPKAIDRPKSEIKAEFTVENTGSGG